MAGSRRRRCGAERWWALGAAVLLVACADASGGLEAVPTAPSSPAVTTAPMAAAATTEPPVTAAPTTLDGPAPEATDPPGITTLGEGPWRRVAGAPGIDTPGLFYELMPELWAYLPVVEDIDQGIGWTFQERDREVIEAYLQARLVYYRAVTQDPMDLDDEGWEYWYADGGADWYMSFLPQRRDLGQVTDLDLGVVLRPQVIGDERSEMTAIVMECLHDGSVLLEGNGELAEDSYHGVALVGRAYRMERIDEVWRMIGVYSADMACMP